VVYGVGHLTLGLLLSVCLAIVSYRYFESPFLRLKESYTVVRSRSV
jgi:peptidoglycan/LPS O-acetylase OafA/YrhL